MYMMGGVGAYGGHVGVATLKMSYGSVLETSNFKGNPVYEAGLGS